MKRYHDSGKGNFANMPQEKVMKPYPKPVYADGGKGYIDTLDGIDMLKNQSVRKLYK